MLAHVPLISVQNLEAREERIALVLRKGRIQIGSVNFQKGHKANCLQLLPYEWYLLL